MCIQLKAISLGQYLLQIQIGKQSYEKVNTSLFWNDIIFLKLEIPFEFN